MSFDTVAFALFFIIFLTSYYVVSSKRRPYLLLAGSYLFYSSINLAFLPLIIFSTVIDYFCGKSIARVPENKKRYLLISLLLNFGMLISFKYYAFTAQNLNALFDIFGLGYSLPLIKLMFPVGISFYTIQTISYTVDVYRGVIPPERNFFKFALYVCFFPQLIAGPLERAKHLIPQFSSPFNVDYLLAQKYVLFIMIGLVKKTIVSDRLAALIDYNVLNPTQLEFASKNFLTYFFVLFRLYYDFSSYSLMGIGIAGLLGISLSKNFNYPLFTTNPVDFWRQWHITFYKWLRDYIYRPLKERNYHPVITVFLVFSFSALWHGAAWTFIAWGIINATYFLIYSGAIRPWLSSKGWSKAKPFAILGCLTNNFVLAATTPVFYIDNVRDCFTFILNGLKLNHFKLNDYWTSLSPQLKSDLIVVSLAFTVIEILSFYFYSKKKSVENYQSNKLLVNTVILVLFCLTFLLSAGISPRIRYYFF